jgi:hypothetical protein
VEGAVKRNFGRNAMDMLLSNTPLFTSKGLWNSNIIPRKDLG